MREKKIESYLREQVVKIGGDCIKLSPVGCVGIPDRLILLPGRIFFVETKKPRAAVVAKMQSYWHDRLRGMGHRVEIAYTLRDVDEIIASVT